jgi:hypothetical protein
MIKKIKSFFGAWLKSIEESGMERARRHVEQYGHRRWE